MLLSNLKSCFSSLADNLCFICMGNYRKQINKEKKRKEKIKNQGMLRKTLRKTMTQDFKIDFPKFV